MSNIPGKQGHQSTISLQERVLVEYTYAQKQSLLFREGTKLRKKYILQQNKPKRKRSLQYQSKVSRTRLVKYTQKFFHARLMIRSKNKRDQHNPT